MGDAFKGLALINVGVLLAVVEIYVIGFDVAGVVTSGVVCLVAGLVGWRLAEVP